MDEVDEYCERVAPGWLGEPANALTNLAFLAAAGVLLWLLHGRRHRPPWHVWLLPVQLAVIGLCSLAYHTFATSFTGLLDTLSIVLFILTAVVQIVHWFWDVPWRWAWLAAPAFLAFSLGLNLLLDGALGGYLPALVGLLVFGLTTGRVSRSPVAPQTRGGRGFLWAAALFAASLTLRTLDEPLCGGFPLGTHFLWHCLNATVLFIVGYTIIGRWQTSIR